MEPSSRLCLVNIPLDMTKVQLIERYFRDLEIDQKEIKFPSSLFRKEDKMKIGFMQFATINGEYAKKHSTGDQIFNF